MELLTVAIGEILDDLAYGDEEITVDLVYNLLLSNEDIEIYSEDEDGIKDLIEDMIQEYI